MEWRTVRARQCHLADHDPEEKHENGPATEEIILQFERIRIHKWDYLVRLNWVFRESPNQAQPSIGLPVCGSLREMCTYVAGPNTVFTSTLLMIVTGVLAWRSAILFPVSTKKLPCFGAASRTSTPSVVIADTGPLLKRSPRGSAPAKHAIVSAKVMVRSDGFIRGIFW